MKSVMLAFAILLAVVSVVYGRTWYIEPDGSGDAPTIQAGLDSATVGDTVLVQDGTHEVGIIFWPYRDGIVLKGSSMNGTILEGNGQDAAKQIAHQIHIISGGQIQEDDTECHPHGPDHADDGVSAMSGF